MPDCDGMTSASLLYNYISEIFYNDIDFIVHNKKVHGIKMEEFSEEILEWTDLLIIADASSSDYKEHEILLKDHHIDTIVLDHHDSERYSDFAFVVNNQLSNYAVNLSGCGMAYKFCKCLDDAYEVSGLGADKYLDLVACSLISDMMDTSDPEVQYLIQEGLRNVRNPMLEQLLTSTSFTRKGKQNQMAFGWNVTPIPNAVTRFGTMEDNRFMFEAFCSIGEDKLYPYTVTRKSKNYAKGDIIEEGLYDSCARMMTSIKGKQDRAVKKALEGTAKTKGLLDVLRNDSNVIVANATKYMPNSGITGLVANKLATEYNKPALVYLYKGNGVYSGSGRSRKLFDFKKAMKESKLVDKAEGHSGAFGTMFKLDIQNEFEVKEYQLKKYFNKIGIDDSMDVDFSIDAQYIEDYMIEDLYSLEDYFGRGMEEPKIHVYNLTIDTQNIHASKKHNAFHFFHNDIQFMIFDKSGEKYNELVGWNDSYTYELIGTPKVEEFNGERYIQIVVEEIIVLDREESVDDDFGEDDDEEFEW